MTTKHTPGPWETSCLSDGTEWGVCREDGGAMIAFMEPADSTEEEQANAQLIAEAPAMLRDLEAMVGLAEEAIALREESSDPEDHEMLDVYEEQLRIAFETIARAKGKHIGIVGGSLTGGAHDYNKPEEA